LTPKTTALGNKQNNKHTRDNKMSLTVSFKQSTNINDKHL